ncbi:uncharacterized protein UV8b_02357 [Ustilaginoidea virens]|uniref:Uncharacterized protein n=1 Tax=Ustilaginoidea virens TaxID=1159556 RepID=A0A8E5HME9_USTVR|nr:uncharacterized protein UV8b_02357 [Ustilaginoidea virens]QUC18116.1 hypothetical protein UV8b_02357 [Ustilaginoidea virens]
MSAGMATFAGKEKNKTARHDRDPRGLIGIPAGKPSQGLCIVLAYPKGLGPRPKWRHRPNGTSLEQLASLWSTSPRRLGAVSSGNNVTPRRFVRQPE